MASMTVYKPGDIVDVPFPFIDTPQKKLRPALVLSEPCFQQSSGACVLMMVTSAERSRWETDIVLEDWRLAGLRKASILRWKIFTIDEQLLVTRRGVLSERDQNKVTELVKINFKHWFSG
jgi:mRNA-degrading endonuclease toxin of MazEF toxin-antitoxin module